MIICDPPKPTQITTKIKSRGYWRVGIRPVEFQQQRVADISALPTIIQKAAVSLRGWDFPHVGREQPSLQSDWIRSEVDWDGIVESWVLFQSAQFLFLGGIRDDWRDESSFHPAGKDWAAETFLNAHEAIFKLVEIYEFAARLLSSTLGSDGLVFDIELVGLEGRHLYMTLESRQHMRWEWYKAEIPKFAWHEELARTELLARPRDFAATAASELFKRFKWEQPEKVVREIQEELRRR